MHRIKVIAITTAALAFVVALAVAGSYELSHRAASAVFDFPESGVHHIELSVAPRRLIGPWVPNDVRGRFTTWTAIACLRAEYCCELDPHLYLSHRGEILLTEPLDLYVRIDQMKARSAMANQPLQPDERVGR